MTSREFAEQICSTLRAAGYLAYLVGGCVRDILLRREPADYDVATNATPERVEQLFPTSDGGRTIWRRRSHRGAEEGIGSTRSSPPSARTSVTPTAATRTRWNTPTPPRKTCAGETSPSTGCCSTPANEVLDYVGGRDDLRAEIIRAIGEPAQRFREDKLRMVRAVRFAARFDYAIEPDPFCAIQRLAAATSLKSPPNVCATT